MYISTLKALTIAIEAIKQLPETDENKQAITRLTNLKKCNRFIHWTKESVFERLNEWKIEHNRNPSVTNLAEDGMPSAKTIQSLFDMRASAFMNLYYPRETPKSLTTKYSNKTKEEWVNIFVQQYNSIQPKSAKEYNTKRDKTTPTWNTIANYLHVVNWTDLIKATGVNTNHLRIKSTYQSSNYTVNSTSSIYEKLEKLLNKS